MRHEAWLVDLDGTLYRSLPVKVAMAAELALFGLRAVRSLKVFREEHERLRESTVPLRGQDPFRIQLEDAALRLGTPTAELEALVSQWMFERPGRWIRGFRRSRLLKEIQGFRDSGGKTALVSDYPASIKLRALGVEDLFEVVVANGESGGPSALKPAPQGYLLAAERLGVVPQACLVLGDREDADGLAASRAGMDFRLVGGDGSKRVSSTATGSSRGD